MKKFDKKEQIKILKIILIIIWMVTVFVFSGQQGTESGNTSRQFTIIIIETITGKTLDLNDPFVDSIQLFIRKTAHFTIYAIGGFLIMNYAYSTNKTQIQNILHSIGFGGVYAITDELHQFFVPGRSAQILDVCIDTIGVITGVFTYMVLRNIIGKLMNNRKIKEI